MWRGLPASKPWKVSTFTPGKKCGTALLEVITAHGFHARTSAAVRSCSSGRSSSAPRPSKNQAAPSPRARMAAWLGRRVEYGRAAWRERVGKYEEIQGGA